MPAYFAFGSNLNHHRLHQRIGDYEHLGIGYLDEHKLYFNKRGGDESGKCTVIKQPESRVWGAICRINDAQKQQLDYFEGVGHGYRAIFKRIVMNELEITALLYQAEHDSLDHGVSPFHWYKAFVLTGAVDHALPKHYIEEIKSVPSINDPDPERDHLNRSIYQGIYP